MYLQMNKFTFESWNCGINGWIYSINRKNDNHPILQWCTSRSSVAQERKSPPAEWRDIDLQWTARNSWTWHSNGRKPSLLYTPPARGNTGEGASAEQRQREIYLLIYLVISHLYCWCWTIILGHLKQCGFVIISLRRHDLKGISLNMFVGGCFIHSKSKCCCNFCMCKIHVRWSDFLLKAQDNICQSDKCPFSCKSQCKQKSSSVWCSV